VVVVGCSGNCFFFLLPQGIQGKDCQLKETKTRRSAESRCHGGTALQTVDSANNAMLTQSRNPGSFGLKVVLAAAFVRIN
jgi:hypothetical protein